jgi:tetrahydromethanopterin S-methyltransferase subunit E
VEQFAIGVTSPEKGVTAYLIVAFHHQGNAVTGLCFGTQLFFAPGGEHGLLFDPQHMAQIGMQERSDNHTIRSATETVNSPSMLV